MNILIVNHAVGSMGNAIRFLDVRDLVIDDVLEAFRLYSSRTGVKIDPIGHVAAKRWLNFDMVTNFVSVFELFKHVNQEHMAMDLSRLEGFPPEVQKAVLHDWAREMDKNAVWERWASAADRVKLKETAFLASL